LVTDDATGATVVGDWVCDGGGDGLGGAALAMGVLANDDGGTSGVSRLLAVSPSGTGALPVTGAVAKVRSRDRSESAVDARDWARSQPAKSSAAATLPYMNKRSLMCVITRTILLRGWFAPCAGAPRLHDSLNDYAGEDVSVPFLV